MFLRWDEVDDRDQMVIEAIMIYAIVIYDTFMHVET